ncbi:hypothetical protein BT96DRAFT_925871 [Gymnopus androsaceus JB14]|uniref:SH3 domain-containing protein n=1 Tax=Gymnopus androsaceus JB14 TaxID=1447944 RepID=A0A6A4GX35_9AGAR|nr:hypothetical protein BT96DRAFT_925871 [Gymnopus androsaceus JB14]
MQSIDVRRPTRNDTFDLRGQIHADDQMDMDADAGNFVGTDDEERSVLEDDDSDGEDREDYMDDDVDDGSSSLSIPNESIDFDLVYSLHSFAATVEGQANVVKGDSLFLMDDSNSYWWLEVGYIPAENIETPFERLARLNKHRNVDLASATQNELQDSLNISQDHLRNNLNSRQGQNASPAPRSESRSTRRDDGEEEWDDESSCLPATWSSEASLKAQHSRCNNKGSRHWRLSNSLSSSLRFVHPGLARGLLRKALPHHPTLVIVEILSSSRKLFMAPLLPHLLLYYCKDRKKERKRLREEESEDSLRKRAKGKEPQKMAPPSGSSSSGGSKLRKERDTEADDGKKKKGKDKDKKDKNGSISSFEVSSDNGHSRPTRTSEESGRPSGTDSMTVSPTTQTAMQQQQQQQAAALRNSMDPRRFTQQGSSSSSELRQKDQQQQALYQQYLNQLQPSYGLHSSSGLGPPTQRARPGSLILNQGVLSVIRVFAGKNLQTEATFKTLVKQALQRFRLPAAEDSNDYYLTVKQMEGSSAPLVAAMEVPKVKRSSVGSISSKLPMNDFSDDSAVKFYLNRRGGGDDDDGDESGREGDDTLIAADSHLTRFSSPSFRFAMQVIIYADDLPEDMAIVFKHTLRDRDRSQSQSSSLASPGLPMNMRRKVFVFPKNIGLERFGILEGVDKSTKRRSSSRVRYGLAVDAGGQGLGLTKKELPPSSKAVDLDSAQLLGTIDDVSHNDPIFILRRATSYRNSTSRHRISEPLSPRTIEERIMQMQKDKPQSQQPTPKEIIAAQRRAKQEKQRDILLSTQTNSVRGVDLLLPGNVRLRSSRYDADDRMRYSYVLPDGAAYDISDIVEEEWRETSNKRDLLEGVVGRGGDGEKLDRVLNKIKKGQAALTLQNRVQSPSIRSGSVSSQYSVDGTVDGNAARSRSVTPISGSRPGTTTPTSRPGNRRNPSVASVMSDASGYMTAASHGVMSPIESSPTARSTPTPTSTPAPHLQKAQPAKRLPPIHTKEDFGVSHMLAVIEYRAMQPKSLIRPGGGRGADVIHPVDDMLFGRPVELDKLHPKIKDIYADSFKKMSEMDEMLDSYLQRAAAGRN